MVKKTSLPSFYLASWYKCNFSSAFFHQLQIRSADEPMTTCAISIILYFLLLLTSGKCKVYRWFCCHISAFIDCFSFYFWRCVNCANQWRENWRTSQFFGKQYIIELCWRETVNGQKKCQWYIDKNHPRLYLHCHAKSLRSLDHSAE